MPPVEVGTTLLITHVYAWSAVSPSVSVALIVKEKEALLPAVPLITPVEVLSEVPLGKVPLAKL